MIFDKLSNNLIGHFNFRAIDWKKMECELAYFIDEAYENRGLITEVVKKCISFGFEIIQLNKIVARIVTTNIASQKVAEKAGLKYEGMTYKDYTTYDQQKVDTYFYAISKEAYQKEQELLSNL